MDVWRAKKEINELVKSGKWDEARIKCNELTSYQKEQSIKEQ